MKMEHVGIYWITVAEKFILVFDNFKYLHWKTIPNDPIRFIFLHVFKILIPFLKKRQFSVLKQPCEM